MQIAHLKKTRMNIELKSAPIGSCECYFPAISGNYDGPTERRVLYGSYTFNNENEIFLYSFKTGKDGSKRSFTFLLNNYYTSKNMGCLI